VSATLEMASNDSEDKGLVQALEERTSLSESNGLLFYTPACHQSYDPTFAA